MDETGIHGVYGFTLTWTPDSASADPSIFTEIEEQLGLKLRSAKVAAPTIEIDRVERTPSAN